MERRQFLQSTVISAAATIIGVAPPAAAATHLSFLQENVMSDPTQLSQLRDRESATLCPRSFSLDPSAVTIKRLASGKKACA